MHLSAHLPPYRKQQSIASPDQTASRFEGREFRIPGVQAWWSGSLRHLGWLRACMVAVACMAGVALQAAPVISSSSSLTFGSTYTATATGAAGALEWALGTGSTATAAAIDPVTGRIAYSSVGTVVIKVRDTVSAFTSDFTVTVNKATIGLSLSNLGVSYDGNPHAALVTPAAIVSTVASGFDAPVGVAVAADGSLYVTDNFAIRKISPFGQITTVAGTAGAAGAVDATGSSARFGVLRGLALDANGDMLVADIGNHVIRKVTAAGVVTTFAGSLGAGSGTANGPVASARFNTPINLMVRPTGDVYIGEYGGPTVRKISGGIVTTFAGLAGNEGGADGSSVNARFGFPTSVARDSLGRYYVTDQSGTVRRIEVDGSVVTVAGAYQQQTESINGPGATARFAVPWGIAVDAQDNVFVSDLFASVIRKISPDGLVTTIAGSPGQTGPADGSGSSARFFGPLGLVSDSQGVLYVAELTNKKIRRIVGAGGTLTVTYNGSETIPSAPGTYTVNATLDHANWQGNATGTLTITAVSLVAPVISSSNATTFRAGYTATVSNSSAGFGAVQWSLGTPLGDGSDAAGAAIHPTTGAVTSTGVGKVVIKARFAGDGGHSPSAYSPDFTITVGPNQSAPAISSSSSYIFGNAYTATANSGFGALTWALGTGSTATGAAIHPSTGVVTATSVGTVVIKARFEGDATHSPSAYTADYPVAVQLSQTAPVISSANSFTVGSGYTATANTGFGVVTWALGTGSTAANAAIDPSTGAVTATSAGTIVIKARFVGDATHAPSAYSADYSVTATGLSQTAPVISSASSFIYGDSYTATANTGFGAVEWALGTGSTATGAAINPTTGALSSTSAGTVVIKARFAGDSTHFPSDYSADFAVLGVAVDPALYGDSHPDLVLQNLSTGARSLRLMNGTTVVAELTLADMAPEWSIATTADFNGDGQPDLVLQNSQTGERAIRLMNGKTVGAAISLVVAPVSWTIVAAADFNGDGQNDLLWQNTATGERSVWFMQGTTAISGASLGTLPVAWSIAAAADFNSDAQTDILWQNTTTGERSVWFMNGITPFSGVSLGIVPLAWTIAGASDFNGDGQTDILWQNTSTRQSAVWFMNGTTALYGADLGLLPEGWLLVGISVHAGPPTHDFNGDGKPDLLWQNTTTGERSVWLMDGTTPLYGASFGIVPLEWSLVTSADFNADGKPDLVWQNTVTGQRSIWFLDGTTVLYGESLGIVPLQWTLVGTGDFNADAKPDLIWQNTATGERSIWFMDGITPLYGATFGTVATEWSLVTVADFNGDGKPDLVWQNTATGQRSIWFMNGTTKLSETSLGIVPLEWSLVTAADFDVDGKPDLLWQNTTTGERSIWFMDGTTPLYGASIGIIPLAWVIVK